MNVATRPAKRLRGVVSPPGDKSISHRALIFNALADGAATIRNCSDGDDARATVAILRALGVRIDAAGDDAYLTRGAGMDGWRQPREALDAGNSGTTLRLLSGALAGRDFKATLTGDASLRKRPMARIIEPLRAMGADIAGAYGDRFAPIRFNGGRLTGLTYDMPIASAQVKSCLLLAGLRSADGVALTEKHQTRDHTERMLKAMGADIDSAGATVAARASALRALDIDAPGDISAALFWAVAAAAHPDAVLTLKNVGLNPTRSAALSVLKAMGADIQIENRRESCSEPLGDIVVRTSELSGVEIGGAQIPNLIDELPVLALAAAMARGETVIKDAAELRGKESDRIAATCAWLAVCGVAFEQRADGLTINGKGYLDGGECDSFGDHRIAMTLGVAGLLARRPIAVLNADAVAVSYKRFWDDLKAVSEYG